MSQILDCPHCNKPIELMRVEWEVKVKYENNAKLSITSEGIGYNIIRPGKSTSVHSFGEPTVCFACPWCQLRFIPDGWGLNEAGNQLVADTEHMKDKL